MAKESGIQWTDGTHNFWEGCKKVDKDCKFCYAERMFSRFGKEFKQVRRTKGFSNPLKWKSPMKIFTCSTSDFFIDQADEWREEAWDIIRRCPQHTFQILTKRPERIMDHLPEDWGDGWDNVWLGTSVGSPEGMNRVHELLSIPAKCRFISFEPLTERVDMNIDISALCRLNWAIIGGESGNENGKYRYRPCKTEWIEELIRDLTPTTAIFIKQLGTYLSKEMGLKDRHGGDWDEWPEHLKIRNFPVL